MIGNDLNCNKKEDLHRYDDIINLPHHISKKHPQMPMENRAAQFAPFAALTGHEAAVKETARLTNRRIELDENMKVMLDEKLQRIMEQLDNEPEIAVTYFVPDEKKTGGEYVTAAGICKKIDTLNHVLIMKDGTQIRMREIIDIGGDIS